MNNRLVLLPCLAGLFGITAPAGQAVSNSRPLTSQNSGDARSKTPTVHKLVDIETTDAPSELAAVMAFPECDDSENLYFMTAPDGVNAIRKLNAKGERMALFLAHSPDIKIQMPTYFSIAPTGDLYQLVFTDEAPRYVFVYGSDGSLKSTIKLNLTFAFVPSRLSVFPDGDFIVAGLRSDKANSDPIMRPFTGLFSSDGSLRKEVTLPDDERFHDMAAAGDPTVVSINNPSSNHAVSGGATSTGVDGNIYLMRRLSPPIVYAISPGGEVVRRFKINPGRDGFMPLEMHLGGDRIAVLFHEQQTGRVLLTVVDFEGRDVATYDEPAVNGQPALGTAFACYQRNPDRVTFVETGADHGLKLIRAKLQ